MTNQHDERLCFFCRTNCPHSEDMHERSLQGDEQADADLHPSNPAKARITESRQTETDEPSNQTPAEALRQIDDVIYRKHNHHINRLFPELEQILAAYAATVEREALEEVAKRNGAEVKPSPLVAEYLRSRLAALQGPIQGDAPDRSEPQTP